MRLTPLYGDIEQRSKTAFGDSQKTLAVLGAFCLFLSAVEYMIPKPLPFLRLGLANLPLILALPFSAGFFWTLVLLKVLAQALISGTLFSFIFLFSIAGTAASSALMFVLYRIGGSLSGASFAEEGKTGIPSSGVRLQKHNSRTFSAGTIRLFDRKKHQKLISFVGISLAGAFFSNITQISLAYFFILGRSALYIAPPVLIMGVVSGFSLGLFCEYFAKKSLWYKHIIEKIRQGESLSDSGVLLRKKIREKSGGLVSCLCKKETLLFFAGIMLSLLLLLLPSLTGRIALCGIFWLSAIIFGKVGKPWFSLITFCVIVISNLLPPYGKVLLRVGPFAVTEGAFFTGLKKAASLEGLIMLSKLTISDKIQLPGKLGNMISESFRILPLLHQKLCDDKKKFALNTLIRKIDEILLQGETL
ncbi:MAG: Gx transporter family protein [Spirochaetaceae bacterium]|jgi:heptaprenyl diphosphate synthase|nr:Gx transporter family protein [Spirochaetaceae bacterium]